MTDFADNSPLFPAVGALVIAGATLLLCRFGGNAAVVVEEIEDEDEVAPDYLFEFDADGVREGRDYERIE
mgnify:FL=1